MDDHAHNLDAPDGPTCACGEPSTHESGWCGSCRQSTTSGSPVIRRDQYREDPPDLASQFAKRELANRETLLQAIGKSAAQSTVPLRSGWIGPHIRT